MKFNLRSCFLSAFFIILFSWIAFFPEPIQGQYVVYTRIFLGLFFLFLFFKEGKFRNPFDFQEWPLWVFLACLSSGLVSAQDKKIAWETYFNLAFNLFFLFYTGKALFSEKKNKGWIALVICIFSSVVAGIGISELYFGRNILYESFISNSFYERYIGRRPMSTQFNPVVLGSYLLGCLPFSFYLIKNNSRYGRLPAIFSLVLSIVVTIWTFSRGVFLGLIALILFYLWQSRKRRLGVIFLCSVVLAVSICSYQKNPNLNRFGFTRLIAGSYDSIISPYRLTRVKMTFKILKDYPFFGMGFNHFRIRFNEYCPPEERGRELYEFMIPDNMYLTFLAETGMAGALGFLVFIFFLFKPKICIEGTVPTKKDTQTGAMQILPKAAFGGVKRGFKRIISMPALAGLLVNMGAYELFYWHNPYMLFCLLCGFTGLGGPARDEEF